MSDGSTKGHKYYRVDAKTSLQGFKVSEVPSNLDAIVIGSGIGGFTTAVLLAKAGYKVIVLEQHSRLGGCCHTFTSHGVEFDAGIHYVGQMSSRTVTRGLFDILTDNLVTWAPLDDVYERVRPSAASTEELEIHKDQDKTIADLQRQFPSDSTAIQKFYAKAHEDGYPCWFFFFRGCFKNLHRLAIFLGFATTQKGGCSEIPLAAARVLRHHGGAAFAKADVEQILCDSNGRAIGLRFYEVFMAENIKGVTISVRVNGQEVRAKHIISDAGLINTFQRLLPPHIALKAQKGYSLSEEIGSGQSEFQIFVVLGGTKAQLRLPAANYWLYHDADTFKESIEAQWRIPDLSSALDTGLKIPYLYATFPSARDPLWEQNHPNGKSTAVVMGMIPWSWFGRWDASPVLKRGEEYTLLKDHLTHAVMEQFYTAFPHLAPHVESVEMGTPVTAKHYLRAPKGEISGLSHRPERFTNEAWLNLRPQTEVPGLFLTGQDVTLGGVAPALWSGALTFSAITNRNTLLDLKLFHRNRKESLSS